MQKGSNQQWWRLISVYRIVGFLGFIVFANMIGIGWVFDLLVDAKLLIIAIFIGIPILICLIKLAFFRCPRCGALFFDFSSPISLLFGKKCSSCGLEVGDGNTDNS